MGGSRSFPQFTTSSRTPSRLCGAANLGRSRLLGGQRSVVFITFGGPKSLARFCCESLDLQHLVESAFPKLRRPNEAQSRQAGIEHLGGTVLDQPGLAADQTQRGGASMHWPCADSVRVRVYGGQIE